MQVRYITLHCGDQHGQQYSTKTVGPQHNGSEFWLEEHLAIIISSATEGCFRNHDDTSLVFGPSSTTSSKTS